MVEKNLRTVIQDLTIRFKQIFINLKIIVSKVDFELYYYPSLIFILSFDMNFIMLDLLLTKTFLNPKKMTKNIDN